MRAVLDTNVLVSALLSRGSAPDLILRAWQDDDFQLVTSPALLAELERVLERPRIADRLGWSASSVVAFLSALAESATMVWPATQIRVVADDPDDDRVIEAAVSGEADYIVSGDRHLLGLGEYETIPIVTPARFAAILGEG